MNNPVKLNTSGSVLYETLRNSLQKSEAGAYSAAYHDCRISSHFQPIVSLTHARVIGHEGLMRPINANHQPIAPLQLLSRVESNAEELMKLDRLARFLHMANATSAGEGWLFLNMHPQVFATSRSSDQRGISTFACQEFGINPGHIVIEILEHSLHDEVQFADAVHHIREHGYLVALDDFGAGHSNFDRVWKLSPDIVKLDREFAVGAEHDARIRRLLPRIVELLHEAGVFVVLEGVETRTQAMIALDANIDFAQGWFFGRPQALPLAIHSVVDSAAELWLNYESDIVEHQRATDGRLESYKSAIVAAATKIAAGATLADSIQGFLALPNAEFCYLLDSRGRQVGENVWHPAYAASALNERFVPVANIGGARWARRPYFRSAIDNLDKPQATRPYLSSASAHICITISLAFHTADGVCVLCGDIAWE